MERLPFISDAATMAGRGKSYPSSREVHAVRDAHDLTVPTTPHSYVGCRACPQSGQSDRGDTKQAEIFPDQETPLPTTAGESVKAQPPQVCTRPPSAICPSSNRHADQLRPPAGQTTKVLYTRTAKKRSHAHGPNGGSKPSRQPTHPPRPPLRDPRATLEHTHTQPRTYVTEHPTNERCTRQGTAQLVMKNINKRAPVCTDVLKTHRLSHPAHPPRKEKVKK